MAKLKMRKYPRKPKASASVATLENYFKRCKEVDKENGRRKSENNKHDALVKRLRAHR